MRALNRKLLRDLWRLRGQVLSIGLVVACGVSTVVIFRSALDSLEASRDAYYRTSRFADVFVTTKRAPEALLGRILQIHGVAAAEPRVVLQVTLDVPGLAEPATGRLVSIPRPGGPGINGLYLRAGRFPVQGRSGEALVSERFATANGIRVGDTLGAVINGRWERLRLVGVALSPEYVFAAEPGSFYTDHHRFGVLWLDHEQLAAAYGMDGAFNDLVLQLSPGASEPAVKDAVDAVLERYGGLGAYGRKDQASDRVISDEIRQNRIFAVLIPAIFLLVATFLLSVVLHRLVSTEREEIAVLKAFGYSDREVGRHYLRFALVSVLLGSVLGVAVGFWLGRGMIGLYAEALRFPELIYHASWGLVLGSVVVSALAAGLGALGAVRRAVSLPPAEAMRPEAPARFGRGWTERVLPHGLTPIGRMIARNLTRRPLRSLNAVLGVAMAMSILVSMLCLFDAFRYTMDVQFRQGQRQELTVAFNAPRSTGVRLELARFPGVERVELFRAAPVRLRHGWRTRQLALTGLSPEPELNRVLDRNRRPHQIPAEGLLLSRTVADILHVVPGDTVLVDVLEGARPRLRLEVVGTVDELLGMSAYVQLGTLAAMLHEAPSASGAHLAVSADSLRWASARLKETPLVGGVSSPPAMLASFEAEIARNLNLNLWITSIFAGIISLGVVYNGARIALSERGRELASLRVLGFTVHEIAVILLGEQAVLTGLGLPFGYALGVAIYVALARSLGGEVIRFPLVFRPSAFLISAGVTLAAAVFAAVVVRRRLGRLDLIAVLKTRE
jgi:putative ABC transport system permease protein